MQEVGRLTVVGHGPCRMQLDLSLFTLTLPRTHSRTYTSSLASSTVTDWSSLRRQPIRSFLGSFACRCLSMWWFFFALSGTLRCAEHQGVDSAAAAVFVRETRTGTPKGVRRIVATPANWIRHAGVCTKVCLSLRHTLPCPDRLPSTCRPGSSPSAHVPAVSTRRGRRFQLSCWRICHADNTPAFVAVVRCTRQAATVCGSAGRASHVRLHSAANCSGVTGGSETLSCFAGGRVAENQFFFRG
jgi:hypothetical protein